MRSIDNDFYRSLEWKRCRDAYMKKANHLCERCMAEGIYEPAKIVHHKIYLNSENVNDPSIAFNFDNLEALCEAHHNREHFKDERRYRILPNGELEF